MTTLSTHDTKRSEDVRARLAGRRRRRRGWERCSRGFRGPPPRADVDRPTAHLRLADPGRRRRRLPGAAARLPRQGDARGQAAHVLARPGPGVRSPGAGPGRPTPWPRPACTALVATRSTTTPRAVRARCWPEAAPADPAGGPGHLPGLRARRPLAGRPRQPPPGGLRRRGARLARLGEGSRPATSTTRSCWSPTGRCCCAARAARGGFADAAATTSRWSAPRGTSSGSSAAARWRCW